MEGPTLDHVLIAAPVGCEAQARWFFGDLVGLEEIPKPPALRGRGGVWFALGSQQLHVGVEQEFAPARKAHPAIRLDPSALDRVVAAIQAAGLAVEWDAALPGERRAYAADPFGNRIELVARGRRA